MIEGTGMQEKPKLVAIRGPALPLRPAVMPQPDPAEDTYIRESSLVLRVRAAIRKVLGGLVSEIKIIVTGGVVELYGELDSEALMDEAIKAAMTVPGVQIAISNLKLR